ncbi:AraC family transcriptional regulator [Sphingomonas sp. Y38-1Y]|uniref:AraC family transcriptional regulator n=1 Tax=Sphingomonas sp. Y38-1Y TaxID=3078265 RepID=UPI0028E36F05|nr:AraC family transcriptional regulator [Sphingomonas sp. Y38-1Y]
MDTIDDLAALMLRHSPEQGIQATAIPRLWLIRGDAPTMPVPAVYEASLCLIAQGSKCVALGDLELVYDASRFLVVSVDLPIVGRVIDASAERPYLCCKLDLDLRVLADLVLETQRPVRGDAAPVLAAHPSDGALIDAVARLVRLLGEPDAMPVLAPLIEREILWRLLAGPHGGTLRNLVAGDTHLRQVARAIALIRERYAEPVRIEEIAAVAGMSASSLHAHFRAITRVTPLEYQKQLRLQEARRLMLVEGKAAGAAGFAVGYDSPSQFSREYRRLFGAPPREDVERLLVAGERAAAA